MPNLQGVDLSEYQGKPDWTAIKRGFDFAVIRASFGTARADYSFTYNRDSARQVGIDHGFYHYAYPEYNSPEAEADFFASIVGSLEHGEFVALDFEESYTDPVGWSLRFLQRAEAHFGVKPLIYLNQSLHGSKDWTPVAKANYGLWAAAWGSAPSAAPWPTVAIWQDSSSAVGGGDHDQFLGTAAELEKYGYSGGATTPVKPTLAAAPAPAPAPQQASGDNVNVAVAQGDSLSAIATRHGVSLTELEQANPQITNPNVIFPGEIIHLPGGSKVSPSVDRVYHVAPGDSLSAIASKFGESLGSLEAKNRQITNPNLIYPGEPINV